MKEKKRVLLIGSGRRMQSVVVPALWCLRDFFEIVSTYSRRGNSIPFFDNSFTTSATSDLTTLDFKKIDIIILAVTLTEVPNVLKELVRYEVGHATLLLDTPVLRPEHLFAQKLFKRFGEVRVSEDTIALPPLLLAKKVIAEEGLGAIKNMYFFHNGYKYHALAGLKTLAAGSIRSVRSRSFPGGLMRKDIVFSAGTRAIMTEPHTYDVGRFLVECERGSIADYSVPGGRLIGYELAQGTYRNLTLDGVSLPESELDRRYKEIISEDLYEKSTIHGLKIRAMMDLLRSAADHTPDFAYAPKSALSDWFAIALCEKLGWTIVL